MLATNKRGLEAQKSWHRIGVACVGCVTSGPSIMVDNSLHPRFLGNAPCSWWFAQEHLRKPVA